MEKAVLYLRISDDKQGEGFSLEAQERLAHDYAEKKRLQIVRVWRVAESAWGKKERKAFSEVLAYTKRHSDVKHIIFDILDRMTRNDVDKLKIAYLVKEFDKTIHFARTNSIYNKDSGPDEEFKMDIEVAVYKKTSNDISRKTKMGMCEKANQGLFPSHAPIGYKNNPITKGVDLDPVNAIHIKSLFERGASASYSLLMLEKMLYAEGLRHPLKGTKVRKSTLHRCIHNPMYYGAFIWGKTLYQGKHEPIISKDLWDKANQVLSEGARPHITQRKFPFNNLMRCSKCGCTYGGAFHKKKYTYYACSNSKGEHRREYLPSSKIESLFESIVADATLPTDMINWLKKGIKERFGRQALELKTVEAKTRENHQSTFDSLEKWYRLKAETEMHPAVFSKREKELKEKLIELESKLNELKQDPVESLKEVTQILEISNGLAKVYAKATTSQKAEILKFVGTGYKMDGKSITPSYRAPFDILVAGHKNSISLAENATFSSKKIIWGPTVLKLYNFFSREDVLWDMLSYSPA